MPLLLGSVIQCKLRLIEVIVTTALALTNNSGLMGVLFLLLVPEFFFQFLVLQKIFLQYYEK